MYLDDLYAILNGIFNNASIKRSSKTTPAQPQETTTSQPKTFGYYCPEIQRVTFNGNTTIVWFVDGTYCIVNCSAGDKYDKKTAIAYAMVKRLLGKVGKVDPKTKKFNAKEIDGAGFGCYLQKIVDKAFDQQQEEKIALEKKRTAKANHLARQAAEKKAAFDRRVEERAKQILLERAAIDRANQIEDNVRSNNGHTGCSCPDGTCSCKTSDNILDTYVRPNKPFSQFTASEKSEYWKYHNAKRRANKLA